MDNRFGYYGMDYNLRPALPEHVNNSSSVYIPNLYYPGVSKPPSAVSNLNSHKSLRSPGPPPPTVPLGPSGGSRSFAAALRNLAKQAGPAPDRERDGEVDNRASSPKQQRLPPPPLVHGPSPPAVPEKERNSEQRSGFQPYRPEEPRPPPLPHFPMEYPAAAYHPGLYPPPPHLQHYRLEEQMYLERCGVGVPPMFTAYPPHTLYGLMPSPLGLMTPAMHERLKLEEEHRQREIEREREREREKREKSKKSPRGSPSHSQQETSARKAPVAFAAPQSAVPHFVRPFEDTFVRPVQKQSQSPPQPPPPLVEQQLPQHPPPPVQDCTVNHCSERVKTCVEPQDTPAPPSTPPPAPLISVPDPRRMLSSQKHSIKVKSRLDVPLAAEELEEVTPWLVLTKGPPDKLDASPPKMRFLSIFGLTTLTRRNEMELTKLARCRSLPSMLVEQGPEPEPPPPLSLPQPRRSPRSLPRGDDKLGFLSQLSLSLLSTKERREREAIWQEVLAERRRRMCVTPLVEYCCEQRVTSPDTCPVRWSGIEGVLQAYQTYHSECMLEEEVLRAECERLRVVSSAHRAEAEQLQRLLTELRAESEELERAGRDTQGSIDTLTSTVRAVIALGHSID